MSLSDVGRQQTWTWNVNVSPLECTRTMLYVSSTFVEKQEKNKKHTQYSYKHLRLSKQCHISVSLLPQV